MALSPVTLNDFKGNTLTTIYAMNPQGYGLGKPVVVSGAQNFSIVGGAALYLSFINDPILGIQLATTGIPIPDNWDGNFTVRQSDPVDGTLDTNFSMVVNSSQGKPITGIWGMTPTIHWIQRKILVDHNTAERTMFYNGSATFAQTLTATTIAELNACITTLKGVADGVSNYRILCQWDGIKSGFNPALTMDFGSGYLQIEGDAGYSPCLQILLTSAYTWGGILFRNMGFVTVSNNNIMFKFGSSIYNSVSYNTRIMFSKCKIGNNLWLGWGAQAAYTTWGVFMHAPFAQEVVIDNECEIDGIGAALFRGTIRTLIVTPKYTKRITGDFDAMSGQFDNTKPFIYSDPHTYHWLEPRYWYSPDIFNNSASTDPPHKDFIQLRPNVAGMTPCTSYFHIENTFECHGGFTYQRASDTAPQPGNQWKSPTVQVLMDNSATSAHHIEISAHNTIFASDSPRGMQVTNGNIYLSWCSFPASDRLPIANTFTDGKPLAAAQQSQSCVSDMHVWGSLLSDATITGVPHGLSKIKGVGFNYHVQKCANVNFDGTSTTATEPPALTRGEIVNYSRTPYENHWIYPLNYDQPDDDFESDLSRQLHHNGAGVTTTYGARLREKHSVTPPGGAPVSYTLTY